MDKADLYKQAFLEQHEELETLKKLLADCYVFIMEYDPEYINPAIKARLLHKIKNKLDGGTIQ